MLGRVVLEMLLSWGLLLSGGLHCTSLHVGSTPTDLADRVVSSYPGYLTKLLIIQAKHAA